MCVCVKMDYIVSQKWLLREADEPTFVDFCGPSFGAQTYGETTRGVQHGVPICACATHRLAHFAYLPCPPGKSLTESVTRLARKHLQLFQKSRARCARNRCGTRCAQVILPNLLTREEAMEIREAIQPLLQESGGHGVLGVLGTENLLISVS